MRYPARTRARPQQGRHITRRINAERLVLLSWSRAILLQLAHPLVAAGIYEHSGFRATRWAAAGRLKQTVRAMLALTFGDDAARAETLERIRAIHRRVRGELREPVGSFPAGTAYSAEDPALLLWVHATLVESVVKFHELVDAPLSPAERDTYCKEAALVPVALNARPDEVPLSWSELCGYLERMYASGIIVVGDQARELASQILTPPFGSIASPATRVNRLVTVGLLPPLLREQYGLQWQARDQRAFELTVSGLRAVRRVLPDALAVWRDARRAMS